VRAVRGGDLYDASFGTRMTGTGPYAEMLATRFRAACRRAGLAERTAELDVSRFRAPGSQGRLFDGEGGAR